MPEKNNTPYPSKEKSLYPLQNTSYNTKNLIERSNKTLSLLSGKSLQEEIVIYEEIVANKTHN